MIQQSDGTLATWQWPAPPEQWDSDAADCTKLPDHRSVYLDYQGPISGDRGTVTIACSGTCTVNRYDADQWNVQLTSDCLTGRVVLTHQDDSLWHGVFIPR